MRVARVFIAIAGGLLTAASIADAVLADGLGLAVAIGVALLGVFTGILKGIRGRTAIAEGDKRTLAVIAVLSIVAVVVVAFIDWDAGLIFSVCLSSGVLFTILKGR